MIVCSYESCDSPAAFLCPQIVDAGKPDEHIYLPVCDECRHHWWEGGDFTEADCPIPTLPFEGGTECGPNAHTEKRADGWAVVWNSTHPDRGKIVAAIYGFASEKGALKAHDRFAPPVFDRRRSVSRA